jgi:hypothetical protein
MGFPSILPVQFVAMPSILKSMGIAHASAKTENINTARIIFTSVKRQKKKKTPQQRSMLAAIARGGVTQ